MLQTIEDERQKRMRWDQNIKAYDHFQEFRFPILNRQVAFSKIYDYEQKRCIFVSLTQSDVGFNGVLAWNEKWEWSTEVTHRHKEFATAIMKYINDHPHPETP